MSGELIFNAFLIIGNLAGIMYLYYRIEKKIDKKISFYANKAANSKEGQMITEILEELHKTIKSKEGKALIKEAEATLKEVRTVLQRLSLKPPEDEEEEDEPALPSLRDTNGQKGA